MQPFRPFGTTPAHLDLKLNNLHSVEMPDFRTMRGGNDPKHTNQDTKEFFKARKRNAWVCYYHSFIIYHWSQKLKDRPRQGAGKWGDEDCSTDLAEPHWGINQVSTDVFGWQTLNIKHDHFVWSQSHHSLCKEASTRTVEYNSSF